MTIDDIDDFEEGLYEEEQQPLDDEYSDYTNEDNYGNSYEEDYEDNDYDEDVVYSLLRNRGIDPNSVKFENENGEIEEVPFDSLSKEEQLQLLDYNDVDDNYGLSQEEVQLINHLRYNNISVSDYNNYIAKQAVNNYASQINNVNQNMQIDYIPDDELYVIDLKSRIPEISDEELLEELENAKSNESVYSKKIESIRNEYREKELAMQQQEQQELLAQQQQQMAQFEQVIVDSIQNNDFIDLGDSSLSLSVDDKNELASFILDTDATGVRHIAKALNDPNTLVKMAWYALKGEEAIRQISNYYKQQISEVSRNNYNKGYEDARSGKAANTSKSIVRKTRRQPNRPLTIDDID